MSQNTFSLEQILDSVNEMRTELRAFMDNCDESQVDLDADAWQTNEDRWFEDCEFDPR